VKATRRIGHLMVAVGVVGGLLAIAGTAFAAAQIVHA
jgi:hypothetical protein